MSATLGWPEIALRLALTVVAGLMLGINRSERGRAVGLRTTLLVCLAASVAMIQVNLLLTTKGKAPDSFAQIDPMRLPLGILTGMGFIGAGAILRRGTLVLGVTTAATLWLITVIGLCFGGGEITLGLAALALGVGTLWGLKGLELHLRQDRRAILELRTQAGGPSEEEIYTYLQKAGYRIGCWDITCNCKGGVQSRTLRCEVRWRSCPTEVMPPRLLDQLTQHEGVLKLK